MADLTGQTPAATYKGLLQVNDYTNGVDATSKYIQDGEGTDSALSVSTTKVGVGTDSPSALLEVGDGTGSKVIKIKSGGGSSGDLVFDSASDEGIVRYEHTTDSMRFHTNGSEQVRIDSSGNVGIGTTSFGTSAVGVLGINNGTAPASSPADMVQLYAEDVSTSSELRVRDEAGNVTTLSPHAKDAPDSLYDQGKGVDEMHRVANHYLGVITFTNVDRRNALLQKQLNGEELPEDRTFTVTETFAEYNARTGADLQVEDWDANQQAVFDAQEEKVLERQAEINAWDNEEEEAPEPLQSYVKKPKPEWLS